MEKVNDGIPELLATSPGIILDAISTPGPSLKPTSKGWGRGGGGRRQASVEPCNSPDL